MGLQEVNGQIGCNATTKMRSPYSQEIASLNPIDARAIRNHEPREQIGRNVCVGDIFHSSVTQRYTIYCELMYEKESRWCFSLRVLRFHVMQREQQFGMMLFTGSEEACGSLHLTQLVAVV